ncbi:MAG TPA: type II secretion system ATPase GspE [Thiobacillus sp.]|nr:type II secretion system ATPase GspE [Thiobacillus sp.]
MAQPQRKLIGQILKEQGFITEAQINQALKIQRDKGGVIGQILKDIGAVNDDAIVTALGIQSGMETIDLDNVEIPADVIQKVAFSIASVYKIIPVSFENNVLTVAMAEPHNLDVLDDVRFMLSCEVKGAIASQSAIESALDKYYARQKESVDAIVRNIEMDTDLEQLDYTHKEGSINLDIQEQISSAPVVKLLNYILVAAIKDQASDIHFEPFEEDFKVRYRVDGVLYDMMPPPRHLASAIISRVKVMSQLNIAETRLPQDGRIQITIGGNPIDMRVSTLPTLFGESVVLRVLDKTVISLDLDRIGLRDDELKAIRSLIDKPHGIVLVTGPTGSGKTTTLYTALQLLNKPDVKILTVEDPVEYQMDGINQIQVKPQIGLTFANALRSIVRQDPDVIMIGEIRDLETAQIAVQSALTGHMVISTLHTNDASSTVNRLLDMGVEDYLLTSTVNGILAQRLVRSLCKACREPYEPLPEVVEEFDLKRFAGDSPIVLYRPVGCEACGGTGYTGRLGIMEMLPMTDAIRSLIMRHAVSGEIRRQAIDEGMQTLYEDGLRKVIAGIITLDEVLRVTRED